MARSRKAPASQSAKKTPSPKAGTRRCGLCGKTGRLTRTDCCGNWICDDEASYRVFSFARNSCARNHGRLTLCGFHFNEGHDGQWQSCAECRRQFEPEMYVYYGTNEYNFSVLADPPAFLPTLCAECGERIVLGVGGYSRLGDNYFCAACGGPDLTGAPRPRPGNRRIR